MNILFISHLCESVASGLNFSVPASIKAQGDIDNVFWLDISDAQWKTWVEVPAYHNIKEFGKIELSRFPAPFNHPDVVVFEGFYEIDDVFFAKKLKKINIPYIIIPRGSLTYSAMHNSKRWKKELAHFFFFDSYINNSLALQYLTQKEKNDSLYRFKHKNYVLPNGFNKQTITKESFSKDTIKAIYIGRLDMYHKGLDMIINIIERYKEMLETVHFSLTLYGPQLFDYNNIDSRIRKNGLDSVLKLGGAISGNEKEKAILDSDVFIMPSRFEGHPMGLIEALAYGLPVLVTEGTNMEVEVRTANAGWSCETNESSLENAFLKMIKERYLLKEKSNNAVQLARRYDWSVIAQEMHNILSDLIE